MLTDSYGTPGGTNDEINQLDSIIDGTGTTTSVTTGIDARQHRLSGRRHDRFRGLRPAQTWATTCWARPTGRPNLDQFGRVVDQVWSDYGTGGTMLDGYGYTYNLQGDVATRQNLAMDAYKAANPSSTAPYLDQAYDYDELDQLTSLTQGQMTLDDSGNVVLNRQGRPRWSPARRTSRRTGRWTATATG